MRQLGCSARILVIILLLVFWLFISGLISGTIGSSLFGNIGLSSFMKVSQPHIELPAEGVFKLFGFPVTNTLIASWFTVIVLVAIFYAAIRRVKLILGRLQSMVEARY